MFFLVRRKTIIQEFAKKIAAIQKRADEVYYRDNPPKEHNNDRVSWLLDQVHPLREMCQKLGIVNQVYSEAYKIYDFRNSGKKGYELKDGKIIKSDSPTEINENQGKVNREEIRAYQLERSRQYLKDNASKDGSENTLECCIISDLLRNIS